MPVWRSARSNLHPVPKNSVFQSGSSVVKMVLNTHFFYIYGLQCDFMQKIQRNTQKIKIADFTMSIRLPSSDMTKNSPKRGSLNLDLLKFLFVLYILHGTWWMFMSRRFSICMQKGGGGCLRPSYGLPKLTLISKKDKRKVWCQKICISHNFENRARPLKSFLPIGYGDNLSKWASSK